ncbi:MAG: flagellar biosynthesis protein [Firmicutes bacterium]|nr:flagellar biosynthesis protein [Bacillota bacterium]
MTNKIPGLRIPIPPQPVTDRRIERPVRERATDSTTFQEVLQNKLATSKLKFSGHAQARLRQRHIVLGPEELTKLEGAVEKAAAKGARESLIVMEGNVFVVSVKNRTVITVIDRDSAKENVFTQIDSAVLTD